MSHVDYINIIINILYIAMYMYIYINTNRKVLLLYYLIIIILIHLQNYTVENINYKTT